MSARCGRALPVLRIEAASCYGRGGDYVCKFSKKNPDSRFLSRKTERFRQAVRGIQTNEVTFAHARGEKTSVQRAFSPSLARRAAERSDVCPCRGEKTSVQRAFSPSRAGVPPNEVMFAHARGEKTSVQRAFSPSRAGVPPKEVKFEHARGEKTSVQRTFSSSRAGHADEGCEV